MAFLFSDKLWFVIGVGITLLLCGLIMFYVKQKFSVYDRHIMEQSQLLKHLVNSIQSMTPAVLSSNGSVEQAKRIHEQFNNGYSRIVVSDDEYESESAESESESESESETETESDSDETDDDTSDDNDDGSESNHITTPIIVSKLDDQKLNIKQINLSNDGVKIVHIEDVSESLPVDNLLENDTGNNEVLKCSDSDCAIYNDVKFVSMKSNDEDEKVDELHSNVDNLENLLNKKKYIELSKNQLQELCKEKNLSTKGSKKELIDRLLE